MIAIRTVSKEYDKGSHASKSHPGWYHMQRRSHAEPHFGELSIVSIECPRIEFGHSTIYGFAVKTEVIGIKGFTKPSGFDYLSRRRLHKDRLRLKGLLARTRVPSQPTI